MINIFVPELSRSVELDSPKDLSYKGIPAKEFTWSKNTFKSGNAYSKNRCYQSKDDHFFDRYNGIMMNPDFELNVPMMYSMPHFMDADNELSLSFTGLRPIRDAHSSTIMIKKTNATLIKSWKRIQTNIDTNSTSKVLNYRRFLFPVFWIDEQSQNKALV